MKILVECACKIRWDDHPDWETVVEGSIYDDHGRWYNLYKGIFRHKESGKTYEFTWQVGATEQQDYSCKDSFGYVDEYEPVEVERKVEMKEVVTWVSVE